MTALRDIAASALDWIKRSQPGCEAEIYLARGEERSIEMRDGALDAVQESQSEGVGLRILRDGRMGFGSAGGVDLPAIEDLFRRIFPQIPFLDLDPVKSFSAPAASSEAPELAASLWDDSIFSQPVQAVLPRLREMEASVLGFDKRISSVLRLGYGESQGEVVIANSRGVFTSERGASSSVGMSAMAKEAAEIQIGSAFQSGRRKDGIDFGQVARDGAARSVALLGSRKIPGGRRAVLFDPWVAGEFLDLIAGLLSAEEVQRGKSLLAGKLGKKAGSALATFIDDPRRLFGAASSLYDDEGQPTRTKTMIEAGVVKQYFYDTYTAGKDGVANNASAGRGSYKGLPSPGSSNFYLAAGKPSREEIISDTKDGVLVLDIMGMHMADPISGEFSVGVSGIAVERGKLTHAVKGAMISGNLLELLDRIDAVGSDLTFYGSTGAPTFRVADMTVA